MLDGVSEFYMLYTFDTNMLDTPLVGPIRQKAYMDEFVLWTCITSEKTIVVGQLLGRTKLTNNYRYHPGVFFFNPSFYIEVTRYL